MKTNASDSPRGQGANPRDQGGKFVRGGVSPVEGDDQAEGEVFIQQAGDGLFSFGSQFPCALQTPCPPGDV